MALALSYPGVYVAELSSGVRAITGVATSVAAFIGRARMGPVDKPVDITGYGDFERIFGGLWADAAMGFAVRDFFANGGARAVIVRVFNSDFANLVTAAAQAAAGKGDGKSAREAANTVLAAATSQVAAAKTALAKVLQLADDATAADVKTATDAVLAATTPILRKLTVDTLTFVAASPGAWAGALRILVRPASPATAASVASSLGVLAADLFDLTVTNGAPGGSSETFANLTVKDTVRRVDRVLTASSLIAWDGPDLDSVAVNLPDFSKTLGDSVIGQAYAKMLALQATNPDPLSDPLKSAIQAYKKSVAEAAASVGDGGLLTSTDFLKPGGQVDKTGLYALEQLYTRDGIFNLLCLPPYSAAGDVDPGVVAAAGAYCEKRRAFLLLDAPSNWNSVADAVAGFSSGEVGYNGANGALFFPRLQMPNPTRNNRVEVFAACGVVAGVFARTDTQRGVWKSPAGIDASLVGVASLAVKMTDEENGLLNPLGVNCLRHFPVFGPVSWGARTTRGADAFSDEYKYIAVKRTALFIEESLYRALKWVVFEPNDEPLWAQIRLNVGAFMHNLFRQNAFQGAAAKDAYFVQCDASTTTQNDINLGIVNIRVGFAPLKPAEFVVLQLQQIAGTIET